MSKGTLDPGGKKLTPYSTKIHADFKQLLDALVLVQKIPGHRDLLERMAAIYEERYPQDFEAAREMVKMLEGLRPAEAPQDGGQ